MEQKQNAAPQKRERDLEEILDLMVRMKCLRVKLGGLEVELSPEAFAPAINPAAQPPSEREPTDEELLFMSAGGPPSTEVQ